LQCVAYGLISTKPRRPQERRLQTLYLALCRILEEYDPQEAAVEKLFFQRNVTTAISVGQARGVALLALAQAGLPVAEYNPQEVKQAVSGYGGADKRQMQHMVQRLLGLASLPKPDDAADALAVAICHLHSRVLRPIQDER